MEKGKGMGGERKGEGGERGRSKGRGRDWGGIEGRGGEMEERGERFTGEKIVDKA